MVACALLCVERYRGTRGLVVVVAADDGSRIAQNSARKDPKVTTIVTPIRSVSRATGQRMSGVRAEVSTEPLDVSDRIASCNRGCQCLQRRRYRLPAREIRPRVCAVPDLLIQRVER